MVLWGLLKNPMADDRLQQAIRLGMAVYRLTDRFPEQEPLRSRLRDASLAVVVSASRDDPESASQAVHTLDALAEVATPLGYVAPVNFAVLKQSCQELMRVWSPVSQERPSLHASSSRAQTHTNAKGTGRIVSPLVSASRRRDRIVQILREQGKARLRELVSGLGGVSARTVRRELNGLCKEGMVERRGFGAASFYRLSAFGLNPR